MLIIEVVGQLVVKLCILIGLAQKHNKWQMNIIKDY